MSARPNPGILAQALALIIFVALPLLIGFAGSQVTTPAIDGWYAGLTKPDLNPPNWIFPVVWTTLYILMGLAAFLVWRVKGLGGAPLSLAVFGLQLVLNLWWSVLFFGAERPDLAIIEIFVLLGCIILMAALFWRHSRFASVLIWPYIAWVGFASYLNWQIVALNTLGA